MLYVRSSISTNSGRALAWVIASVVAMKVLGTVTTQSPARTPAAIRAKRNASVPLLDAHAILRPAEFGEVLFQAFDHRTANETRGLRARNETPRPALLPALRERLPDPEMGPYCLSFAILIGGSIIRSTLAGFPATIAFAGTSLVTRLPAPTMAFSPTTTLERIVLPIQWMHPS